MKYNFIEIIRNIMVIIWMVIFGLSILIIGVAFYVLLFEDNINIEHIKDAFKMSIPISILSLLTLICIYKND